MFEVDRPLRIETKVAQIISEQGRNGVHFESIKANILILELAEKIAKIDKEAVPQMPRMMVKGSEFKKPFLKSGKPSQHVQAYADKYADEEWLSCVAAPFTRVWYTDFDMGKVALVKDWLIKEGWEPEEWNIKKPTPEHVDSYLEALRGSVSRVFMERYLGIDKLQKRLRKPLRRSQVRSYLLEQRYWPTSPKIPKNDEQFDYEMRNVNSNVGKLVRERLMLSHRRSLVRGLTRLVRADGRISAQANPCATPTFRANYRGVVNIPASRSPYGKQLRSLFTPNYKDHVFLGSDASGLELRMLAHYMDDKDYTEQILHGDIHTYNQEIAGLSTRDQAKTMIYCLMYGGGDAKLGEVVGGGKKEGREIRDTFMSGLPKYASLVERVTREAASGSLLGLDNRRILMRRNFNGEVMTHKALNTLLQSAGAIVMKYSMCILDGWVKGANLDAQQVLWQHDEVQFTVDKKDVDMLKLFTDQWVTAAGKQLNMNILLESDTMIGRSWYECH